MRGVRGEFRGNLRHCFLYLSCDLFFHRFPHVVLILIRVIALLWFVLAPRDFLASGRVRVWEMAAVWASALDVWGLLEFAEGEDLCR